MTQVECWSCGAMVDCKERMNGYVEGHCDECGEETSMRIEDQE